MNKRVVLHWGVMNTRGSALGGPLNGAAARAESWEPSADVCESCEGLLVRMALAGLRREDLEITLEENVLIVRGERRDPACGGGVPHRFHQLEIEYGAFERRLPLPCRVDGRRVTARLAHGLLEIRLPRADREGPRSVRVEMES